MAIEDHLRLRASTKRPKLFYKYMTDKVAKIVLVNHTLRWSSPSLFNDPFDITRDFSLGFDIEEIKEPLIEEIKKLIHAKNMPDLTSNPIANWFIGCLRNKDLSDVRDIILDELPHLIDQGVQRAKVSEELVKKQWSEFIPEFRILCLSEIYDNLLMWSHYSDSHRGVVLELQSIEQFDSPWLIAQPIIYQSSPPILVTVEDWVKSLTGQKHLDFNEWRFYEPLTLTKTKDWEYEKEWRVVDFMRQGESGCYQDCLFNPPELRAIYLGCEISNEDAGDIISLLKYDLSHVLVYRMKKIDSERKLSFERVK